MALETAPNRSNVQWGRKGGPTWACARILGRVRPRPRVRSFHPGSGSVVLNSSNGGLPSRPERQLLLPLHKGTWHSKEEESDQWGPSRT